ncbi:MAG: hypothetical protein J6S29_04565 [Methanosphaera sp.]|nr:hypothetical protein [Methanosphaera sp.]
MEYFESEWEYLQNPKEFANIKNTNVNVEIDNILIQRENQYKIVMQLTVYNLTKKDMKKLKKLSTFIFKDKFILHRIECSYKTTQKLSSDYPNKHVLIYNVYRIERKKTTYSPAKKIDWFLNSIKYQSNRRLFCQQSEHKHSPSYSGKNQNSKIGSNKSFDKITVSCPKTKFRRITIRLVDDKYQPFWSDAIAVEYAAMPTKEESEKIHLILNFIFGCYLIKIGTTNLDINNKAISEVSVPPEEGFDVKYICHMPEKSIILPIILEVNEADIIIKKISYIINTYLNLDVDLNHSLNLYTQSLISNPNIEIIMLDAALESFAQTMGFEGLAKKKIYSFIYDCGIGTKEDGIITLGTIEDDLRTMRNNITHGQLVTDKQELYYSNLAYRVLYGRILLKFLKINKYYDLTTGVIRPIGQSIDAKKFYRIQAILKKEKYSSSRKYYMDLHKLILKG